jgi:hypothetical protein
MFGLGCLLAFVQQNDAAAHCCSQCVSAIIAAIVATISSNVHNNAVITITITYADGVATATAPVYWRLIGYTSHPSRKGSRQTRENKATNSGSKSEHIVKRALFSKQQLYSCCILSHTYPGERPGRKVALSSGSDCDTVWLRAIGVWRLLLWLNWSR